jgi:hypothetical protein
MSHPASYRGRCYAKGELQRRRAQRAKLVSPEQSYAAALRQDRQPASQTDEENLWSPVQQHLPQQEIHKTGLLEQAPSSSNIDMMKVATVVHQIITDLSESL